VASDQINIEKSKILIVEGKDEELFFHSLLGFLSVEEVQVMPIGGKTRLTENLRALQNATDFDQVVSLGIVRDGNSSPASAFQSVCSSLRTLNLPTPSVLGVSHGNNPRVAVLILPDGQTPGMLEDVCLNSISSEPIMECIDGYFGCIESKGLSLPLNNSKAKVHVFLAAQRETGKRLGEAAEAGYWPFTHQSFTITKEFLQIL